jgi:hypothetical protein
MIVIKILSAATGQATDFDGTYIKSFDVEAHDGRGELKCSPFIKDAKQFPDRVTAHEFWRQQSNVTPIRPDGKPNRPLTYFNVELVPM